MCKMTNRQKANVQRPLCYKCPCTSKYYVNDHYICGRCCTREEHQDKYRIDVELSDNTGSFKHVPVPEDPTKTPCVCFYNDINNRYAAFGSFYEVEFSYNDVVWPSAEHAYQAMKFFYETGKPIDEALFEHYKSIVTATNSIKARKLGKDRQLPIRRDWNAMKRGYKVKDCFMFDIVLAKVEQNPIICKLLLDTKTQQICLMNTNEPYWGVGKNMLGNIYMMVRDHIMKKRTSSTSEAQEAFA